MRARLKQLYQKLPPSYQNLFHNGTPEIVIGSSLLIFISYDYYVENRQTKTRQKILIDDMIMQQKQQQLTNTTVDESIMRNSYIKEDREEQEHKSVALYSCKVVYPIPLSFDGYKCLIGVKLNDIVEVIEENTGPGERYHLCKLDNKVGWLPDSYLKRI